VKPTAARRLNGVRTLVGKTRADVFLCGRSLQIPSQEARSRTAENMSGLNRQRHTMPCDAMLSGKRPGKPDGWRR
jgi:hypothetical protein